MIRFDFTSHDGKRISVVEWNDVENPKGIIQISHGMVEHARRYDIFAAEMNKRGYIVFADDHRAHGETDPDTLGYCAGDIYGDTLKDLGALAAFYKEKYNLPLVLFSHSYGSFLGQRYVQEYGNLIEAAVIGGSSYMNIPSAKFAAFVASAACAFGKEKKPAQFIKKQTFDVYDKKFGEGESFISSIHTECDRYNADEKCNFVCSYNFYKWFFKGILKAYKKENLAKLRKDLPLLLMAGESDPVGNMGKGVSRLEETYRKLGLNVRKVLYKGVRHEFLNDISREDAFNTIAAFYDSAVAGK